MKKYLREFLAFLRYEKNSSVHTISAYRRDVLQFIEHLKKQSIKLKQVDNSTFHAFLIFLNRTRSNKKSTVGRKIAALRSFFKYAEYRGWIRNNPARLLYSPKPDQPLPSFLTELEAATILNQPVPNDLSGLRDRAILELLYASGIRVSELTGLDLKNFDFPKRSILVRGKGKIERLAFYGPLTENSLLAYLKKRREWRAPGLRRKAKGAVFLSHLGTRITPRSVERMIEKYTKQADIGRRVHPHSFRHSFATHLLGRGADLRFIQELMGHKSLRGTQKYLHPNVDQLLETHRKYFPVLGVPNEEQKTDSFLGESGKRL